MGNFFSIILSEKTFRLTYAKIIRISIASNRFRINYLKFLDKSYCKSILSVVVFFLPEMGRVS